MMRWSVVCFVLALSAVGGASAQDALRITDTWVPPAPPTAMAHAAYFVLANPGKEARHLVGAASLHYDGVELHASRITSGVATMEPVVQAQFAPGASIHFAPGSLHLMLIGPQGPQKAGASVPFTLAFSDGSKLSGAALVTKDGRGGGHPHHGH
jgi:copper(I)-binding protein